MILATHQPIFLPWPGFFYKAGRSECMILLDDVQFPRGRSWLTRNRLKNEDGEMWLTVPVWRKGRGVQIIRQVETYDERGWRRKHLQSIRQNYVNAPYFEEYFQIVESIYARDQRFLVEFNIDMIRFFWDALSLKTEILLQSDLGVTGKGTDLLVKLCKRVGADRLLVFPMVEKHLDPGEMRSHGIDLVCANFHPPVYPQLWGEFVYNLSTLDLLLNCGSKAKEIVEEA
ncbi:MAG: WbqC family protein [Candidatus Latescibacterota bacterium]|nr:MAG: WbqC family protein [Candidatus Latescibacterota bacterium]